MNQFDNDKDVDVKRLQQACAVLHEHYETVQIFITHTDDSGHNTKHAHYGVGNCFARYGHIAGWVKQFYESPDELTINPNNGKKEWE